MSNDVNAIELGTQITSLYEKAKASAASGTAQMFDAICTLALCGRRLSEIKSDLQGNFDFWFDANCNFGEGGRAKRDRLIEFSKKHFEKLKAGELDGSIWKQGTLLLEVIPPEEEKVQKRGEPSASYWSLWKKILINSRIMPEHQKSRIHDEWVAVGRALGFSEV